MRLRAPARVTASGDDGFSLVEAVVALAISTAIFTALAFALVGGAKSALLSQQNQQAGDVLNQAVEQARALPYEALAMRTADLDVGEAGRTPALSAGDYNPADDTTSGATESLVVDANGGVATHVEQQTDTANGGTFTVRRYVTAPADAYDPVANPAGARFKRLTVVVDWSTLGKDRTRTYSTLVADTKRGLPLPDFKLTNASALTQCRNPGSLAVYTFNIRNNGARDSWNLTTTPTSPVWSFYRDTNGNDLYDDGTDVALPLTSGVPSTGLLEPTTAVTFFAKRQVSTEGVFTTTFRATSAAQSAYLQELATVTTVTSGVCSVAAPTPAPTTPPAVPPQPPASCASLTGAAGTSAPSNGSMVTYFPINPGQPGDTPASVNMPVLKGVAPATGDLYNYSTNLHTGTAGRYLGPNDGDVDVDEVGELASWSYGMPANSEIKGIGEVTLWAAPADGTLTAKPRFRVSLELLSASGSPLATLATASYATGSAGWGCAGLRPISLSLNINTGDSAPVAQDQRLRLSVRLDSTSPASPAVRLGYGTAAYPMTLTLPYKKGDG